VPLVRLRERRNPGGLACLPKEATQGPFRGFRRQHIASPVRFQSGCRMIEERSRLERLFGLERLQPYVAHCGDDLPAAMEMYQWNGAVAAAFWGPIGHLEVALRNTVARQLASRHLRLGRALTWLDDPCRELSPRAREVIAMARRRVRQKGKPMTEGQMISELSFGFWRFLFARRSTGLWPDLTAGFPNAPDRRRETVEEPIARLHDFRNRLAHHQRIWNRLPGARYADLMLVAGFIDAELPAWIERTSAVPALLRQSSQLRGTKRRGRCLRLLRKEWSSLDARLECAGARRLSPAEFDKHFGDLPTDGEG